MRKRSNNYYAYVVAFILFICLVIRLYHINYGLPYRWADDAKIFYFANIMLYDRDPIPNYFMYSSISMYIQAIVMLVIGAISKLLVALGFSTTTLNDIVVSFLSEHTINYQLKTEFAYYSVLLGKVVFATFSVFSGYFVYKILRRCTGNYFISIIGLILNCFLFIQFQYSMVLRQENLSLFFLVAMAYYTIVFYDNPSRWRAVLLGGISALCVTTEYSLAPILIVPIGTYYIRDVWNSNKISITDIEVRHRIRQATLLLVVALGCYSILVYYIATVDVNSLKYFWSLRYELGALVITTTLIFSILVYTIYRFFIRGSKVANQWYSALINRNYIPYYFIYGFLPVVIIFNMGIFIKPLDYGRQVFGALLRAYTHSFRIYTLSTSQMVSQVKSYIINEQMGYIYTCLMLLCPLLFLNTKVDKERKHKAAIILSFVVIMLLFIAFYLHLFHPHRFMAISSLQVCLVTFSLFNIHVFLKHKNRIMAYGIIVLLVLFGIYPHLNKITKLGKLARVSDTRTFAASWLGKRVATGDVIVIDKALCMDSVDLKRHSLNVVFLDVNEDLITWLEDEEIEPVFIVTTNRKIDESEFDRIHEAMRSRFILNHLVYPPLYESIFQKSLFELDCLLSKYQLKKTFVRNRKIGPKESYYDFPVLPRVSIMRRGESPSLVCNPDILAFERLGRESAKINE